MTESPIHYLYKGCLACKPGDPVRESARWSADERRVTCTVCQASDEWQRAMRLESQLMFCVHAAADVRLVAGVIATFTPHPNEGLPRDGQPSDGAYRLCATCMRTVGLVLGGLTRG